MRNLKRALLSAKRQFKHSPQKTIVGPRWKWCWWFSGAMALTFGFRVAAYVVYEIKNPKNGCRNRKRRNVWSLQRTPDKIDSTKQKCAQVTMDANCPHKYFFARLFFPIFFGIVGSLAFTCLTSSGHSDILGNGVPWTATAVRVSKVYIVLMNTCWLRIWCPTLFDQIVTFNLPPQFQN